MIRNQNDIVMNFYFNRIKFYSNTTILGKKRYEINNSSGSLSKLLLMQNSPINFTLIKMGYISFELL